MEGGEKKQMELVSTSTSLDSRHSSLVTRHFSSVTRHLFLWFISLVLWLPTTIPYMAHFLYPRDAKSRPTGYIQTDMPYYMANAREHFDNGGFTLTYGLPYSPNYDTPKVYFQPHTLLLGLIWKATGWNQATIYLTFGFISGWICVRIALAVYARLFGLDTFPKWLGAIAWVWGGGILVILGYLNYLYHVPPYRKLDDLFFLDPFDGMWFLNLGRNLIFPTEAYYHAIFLGMVYFLLEKRFRAAAALLLLLSMSHPFTGIEAILIVLSWALLERFWIGNREIPLHWISIVSLIFLGHVYYYLRFLPLASPEHQSLQEQWTLDWTYEAKHFVPAYFLVGLLTLWSLRTPALAGTFLGKATNRFFLVWFLVAFALANHEFAFKPPMQPLHFTRGYVWMPLFLMGAQPLLDLFTRLMTRPSFPQAGMGISVIMAVFLSDNMVFLTTFHSRTETSKFEQYVPDSWVQLADFFNQSENKGSLVVSLDWTLNYYIVVQTPLRTCFSHVANTPYYEKEREEISRKFFIEGKFLPKWSARTLLVIYDPTVKPSPEILERGARVVYTNEDYQVYRLDPHKGR